MSTHNVPVPSHCTFLFQVPSHFCTSAITLYVLSSILTHNVPVPSHCTFFIYGSHFYAVPSHCSFSLICNVPVPSHCTFCSYINKCHRTFVPVPSHCTSFFLFKFNTQCTSALTLYFFSFVDHIPVSVPSHCTVFSLYTMYQCPHTVLSLFIHKKCHHTLYQCHHTVPSFSCSVSITQCTSAITLYSHSMPLHFVFSF